MAEYAPIRPATMEDKQWVTRLFNENKHILGTLGGARVFWRCLHSGNPREYWVVIPEVAFAHYLVRRDGVRALYEIAVSADHRRKGLGRALMEHIGRPVSLKTDTDNVASNDFYRSLGLVLMGHTITKTGKSMSVYQGW